MYYFLIVIYFVIFNSLEILSQSPITEEYSVVISNGRCTLESNQFDKIGNNWYDTKNCRMYECSMNGAKAKVKQSRCSDLVDSQENCRMMMEKGMFPTCCYGRI